MCETCTDHMKKTTLEAQDSLKNILVRHPLRPGSQRNIQREYSVLSQEDVDLKKRISFVDVFRKLDQDRRELIGKRILQMLEKVHDENIPVKYMDVWYNTDVNKVGGQRWPYAVCLEIRKEHPPMETGHGRDELPNHYHPGGEEDALPKLGDFSYCPRGRDPPSRQHRPPSRRRRVNRRSPSRRRRHPLLRRQPLSRRLLCRPRSTYPPRLN